MLGQRRANAHTLGGVGPCGAGDPGGTPRGARASRALRARVARAHGAFGAARAEGPKGQGGHWDFSEGWPNGRVSKEETHLKCFPVIIVMPNAQTLYFFYSGESLPLGIIWGRQGFESSRLT